MFTVERLRTKAVGKLSKYQIEKSKFLTARKSRVM